MKRGEIWTASGRGYAGKPRPVLIVQDDRFDATDSATLCPLTTDPTELPLLRIPMRPNVTNGLAAPSSIMVDKITTVHKSKLGQLVGRISTTEMLQVERGLLVYLGIAG